jgi:hypothetical protein
MMSDDAVSLDYTISTLAQKQSIDLTQGLAVIDLSLSNQSPDVTIAITVTDSAGNSVSFYTVFCTSCLIEVETETEVDDQSQEPVDVVGDESTEESNSQDNLLIGLSIVLVLCLGVIILRGPKAGKTPAGLPTKSEDEWISKYTNKK